MIICTIKFDLYILLKSYKKKFGEFLSTSTTAHPWKKQRWLFYSYSFKCMEPSAMDFTKIIEEVAIHLYTLSTLCAGSGPRGPGA